MHSFNHTHLQSRASKFMTGSRLNAEDGLNLEKAVGTTDHTDCTDQEDDAMKDPLTEMVPAFVPFFLIQVLVSVLSVQSVVYSDCSG